MEIDLSPASISIRDWRLIILTGFIGQTLSIVTQETGTAPYSIWWLKTQADWIAISNPAVYLSVLYLGIVSTTLGFCAWNKGLLYMDASIAGIFMFFQPIVGTILGYLVLDEPITIYFWIGFALIVTGVLLSMRR